MAGVSTITVDLTRGEVLLAGNRIPLADARTADDPPGLPRRFRLADGGLVRVVTFGERSRLVKDALASEAPARALLPALRQAAHEGPVGAIADAVLLAVTGGGEPAPEFERCAVEASRLQSWSWQSVQDAPAIVVDRATVGGSSTQDPPYAPDRSGEWNRFVFTGGDGGELEALVDEMITRLLARGVPQNGQPHLDEAEAPPLPTKKRLASKAARAPSGDERPELRQAAGAIEPSSGIPPASTRPATDRGRSSMAGRISTTAAAAAVSTPAAEPRRRMSTAPTAGHAASRMVARTATSVAARIAAATGGRAATVRSAPSGEWASAARDNVAHPALASSSTPTTAQRAAAPMTSVPRTPRALAGVSTGWPSARAESRGGQAWPAPPRGESRSAPASPAAELLPDETIRAIAMALAAECDLRGIDG
jgi:hypothetical protein